jgi:2-amino-4-hydroxy-6-hydroxymethyldihydropteridine diphosphokinase
LSLDHRPARRAFVGLGSNVDPAWNLRAALMALGRAFAQLRRSPVCVSQAVGYDGPDYWNLCVAFDTELSGEALVARLKDLERSLGRQPGEPRHAPKTLDADLLLLGDETSVEPPLPHPEILTRAYVLGPLAMLAPGHRLPGGADPVSDLWRDFAGADELTVLEPDPL